MYLSPAFITFDGNNTHCCVFMQFDAFVFLFPVTVIVLDFGINHFIFTSISFLYEDVVID